MTLVTKIAQNRFALSMIAVLALSLVFGMQPAHGQSATDTFGLDAFGQASDLRPAGNKNLPEVVADLIDVALGLLGMVAVIIILAGGFKWMTAGGSEDKVAEARKLIFAGVIGLAIILSAFAIARFVLSNLSSATGTGNVL